MSTILHRRELHVAITAEEAGREFADSPCDVQAEFLKGFVAGVKAWSGTKEHPTGQLRVWPMQCRFIVDELNAEGRANVAVLLDTLLDHLRESVDATEAAT